jgi:hypothetical protein
MERHKRVAGVQESACAVLWVLADTLTTESAARDVAEAVLSAMWYHRTSAGVQEYGCAALSTLACNKAASGATAIIRYGGVASVQSAMRDHVDWPAVQRYGCAAMGNLCAKTRSTRTPAAAAIRVVPVGGCRTSGRSASRRWGGYEAHVQRPQCGCGALFYLTLCAACYHDAVDVVLSAMRVHRDSPAVQLAGCGALQRLAMSVGNAAAIADADGVADAVVLAMRSHPDDGLLQHSGCGALQRLAGVARIKAAVLRAGGRDAIEDAKRRHNTPTADGALQALA